jgi:hypothetical protein
MGCGGGKEKVHEEEEHDDDKKKKDKKINHQPAVDDKARKPATTLHQLQEMWSAGDVEPGVAPLFLTARCGPFTYREKVPPQNHISKQILFSNDTAPPRIIDEAAEDAAAFPTEMNVGQDLHMRAFLPHALRSYCVGWAKPNLTAGGFVDAFVYDVAHDGASDLDAVAAGECIEDVGLRRRVLLFPEEVTAIGLFLRVDDGAPRRTSTVLPYSAAASTEDAEPMDDAFLTYSTAALAKNEIGGSACVPSTKTENSLAMTLWAWAAGGAAPDAHAHQEFAAVFGALPEGEHTLQLSLRFRFNASRFTAVYSKPATAAHAPAQQVVGTYVMAGTTPTLATSSVIASSALKVTLDHAGLEVMKGTTGHGNGENVLQPGQPDDADIVAA